MPIRDTDLNHWGVPEGEATQLAAIAAQEAARRGIHKGRIRRTLRALLADAEAYLADPVFGPLATHVHATYPKGYFEEAARRAGGSLVDTDPDEADRRATAWAKQHGLREPPHGPRHLVPRSDDTPRDHPVPWKQYGPDPEPEALEQMIAACRLPIAVAGALMPDAHLGYGLPIGGVLAVRGAVIPYAVGVDIACRMKLTVLDLPVSALAGMRDRLRQALEAETRFGVGAEFGPRREHDVMDDPRWQEGPVTRQLRDKAWAQLGTSGGGNHFAEFGALTVLDAEAGLAPGEYLALLSHSGSRGTGLQIANHYSRVAMSHHPGLPRGMSHLAWLDLDSADGREYWLAMQLMGDYAAANHALIHRHVARHLGVRVLLDVENHHNFAWRERVGDETLVVHRKGATPAHDGTLGVIPGTMATPGYLVRGLGNPLSLQSASHGAGRQMSRAAAKRSFTWSAARKFLEARKVTLLSGGLDEVPMAYKDIETVMAAQSDLVRILARFDPRIVRMSSADERPED